MSGTLKVGGKTLATHDTNTDVAKIQLGSTSDVVLTDSAGNNVLSESSGTVTLTADEANVGSNALVVDSSGNVGIGTSSPSATYGKLTVAGTGITILDDGGAKLQIGRYSYGFPNSYIKMGANSNSLRFTNSTDSLDVMTLESSGNVGIGTSSLSYQLQLSTDSAGKPSTNTWTIVSDERIKENIELANLDLCYNAVKSIPLKRFKWRDEVYSEKQVADRHKLGWIAQDVEAVYPKAVNIHEFRYNQIYNETIIPAVEEELDEEGNVITEAQEERIEKELVSEDVIEDCRNLNADQIYAAMYGAIQKLIEKVESQQSQIDALTARIEALEATP